MTNSDIIESVAKAMHADEMGRIDDWGRTAHRSLFLHKAKVAVDAMVAAVVLNEKSPDSREATGLKTTDVRRA